MFGSGIIDLAIGVILVYLFLSLICSVITEWISKKLEMRAKNLEEGIRSLLSDPQGTGHSLKLFDHPLIKGLSKNGRKPSYVPSSLFAIALMDIISPSDPTKVREQSPTYAKESVTCLKSFGKPSRAFSTAPKIT